MFQLGKKQEGQFLLSSQAQKIQKATWNQDYKRNQVGVDDMTLLSTLSNEAINTNLSKRFSKNEIYTYIGNVLISLNPFQDLPIYTDPVIHSYVGRTRIECPPHIYAIAETALARMKAYQENQCVIISGESGAGKTEAAKKIMQYISTTVPCTHSHFQHIKEMVMATNPLLESFGNAKTLRNHNSSRFGKYLEIFFHRQHEPVGANVRHYLLEKSRVVHQVPQERNFHIFYQICKAAAQTYPDLGLSAPANFKYTSQSQCTDVDGIDDVRDYHAVVAAMRVIGVTSAEQRAIHQVLAGILWLGNVGFRDATQEETAESGVVVTDTHALQWAARVLEVPVATLTAALTRRSIVTPQGGRTERIASLLNVVQACTVRDALAKAIYVRLFDWIVARVNAALTSSGDVAACSIGILDIYGFEVFQENSFEQLCINFVNEKLQQIFIELTLKAEQEDYIAEGIEWSPIAFFDNKIVCELIEEKRPPGVFAILCDVCARIHGEAEKSDAFFCTQLGTLSHPRFHPKPTSFLVRHYAGDVTYQVQGMCEKNRDQLNKDVLEAVKASTLALVHTLFPEQVDWDQRQRPTMVSEKMKVSAAELSATLMACHPNYVRCIKPNEAKKANVYQEELGLHQIQYLGLLQNVKVRRAGFAAREPFGVFLQRFYMLSSATCYAGVCTWKKDVKSGCEMILKHSGIPPQQWQLGKTKVFIKNPETMFKLESLRDSYWHRMARRIQRAWRRYQCRRAESATKIQRVWRDRCGRNVCVQMRDFGHTVLAQRGKERRRFSLVSLRRYVGDYLDVAGKGGVYLRGAARLDPHEWIVFSARVEVPVHRLLKAAKLSPRMLVLTDQSVALVATVMEEKQVVQKLAFKAPVASIQGLEVSPFQDDFVMVHLSDMDDFFLVCPFKTEFITYLVYQWKKPLVVSTEIAAMNKKNKKVRSTKFIKDDTIDSVYKFKGDKVLVKTGAPPSSVSNPSCRHPARPPTHTSTASSLSVRPKPEVATTLCPPSATRSPLPLPAVPVRPTPPPPPPPPARTSSPRYEVLYAFAAQQATELALVAGEEVDGVTQEPTGWTLVKNTRGEQGWVPSTYLKLLT